MSSQLLFERTNDLMLRAVQIQCFDRCPADGGDAVYATCHPAKVMIPRMLAGMKQPHDTATLRITGILPCAFAQRAVDAGQCEIVHAGITTCHLRYDMIHMKRGRLAYL